MTEDPPARPRVVLTTTASVDGRVTLSRAERLLDSGVWQRWRRAWPADVEDLIEQRDRWLAEQYAPTAVLQGSGTFVADEAVSRWPASSDVPPPVDHLPRRAPSWFVVVDSRGRVDWTFTGNDERALLVVVCRTTPSGYLARLRELAVGYLVAGDASVDLELAVRRLGDVLGVTTILADGGGGINGAMLRAGLIDELHVITFPALIGGLGTPSLLDGPALDPGAVPVRLSVRGVVRGAEGSVWTRYAVEAS